MPPLQCTRCGSQLASDDIYCGTCGAVVSASARAVPPVEVATQSVADSAVPQAWAPRGHVDGTDRVQPEPTAWAGRHQEEPPLDQFFRHAVSWPEGRASNATRYLCAAAYLDPVYTNRVIGELLASRRAVAPSCGIDLTPIVRHCLHARKMQLIRDVLLTVFLLGGLYLAAVQTVGLIAIAFVFSWLPGIHWRSRSLGFKVLTVVGVMFALSVIGALWATVSVLAGAGGTSQLGALGSGLKALIVLLVVLGLICTTLGTYTYSMCRIFGEKLRPATGDEHLGLPDSQTQTRDTHLETRIAQVDAAQRGNVTLYSGENPFVGAGDTARAWSIAIELDRAPSAGRGGLLDRHRSRGYVPIDPVELHAAIRDRLLKLRDPQLPDNERIFALTVNDHIVGEGVRSPESPLIDQVLTIPYSQATPEAIDALIRHPQGGLRYYQRVSVSDEGQDVWAGQHKVISRADQEVAVSAFIYVAVEGRMFYLEFVSTILPPVLAEYHAIDLLPKVSSSRFITNVLSRAASTAFNDMVRAPFRAVSTLWRIWSERRSFASEISSAADYVFADIGTHASVRELGSAPSPRTYIQKLDAEKYTKIIERLVTDTVLDFLVAKGADASAYQASAQMVVNAGVLISGGTVTGPVASSVHGPVTQTNTQTASAELGRLGKVRPPHSGGDLMDQPVSPARPEPSDGGPAISAGVYVGGGTVSGPIAGGVNGPVTQINNMSGNASDVLRQIDNLLRKLEAEASGLPGERADEVVDEVSLLHAEVHRRKINSESIRAALARLTTAVGSATTLLASVDQLRELATALLH
jgi:hypothetical protein